MNSTFRRRTGIVLTGAAVLAMGTATGAADEVRRWRDEQGRLHVEIRGPESGTEADATRVPVLRTTAPSAEEKFSIAVSRRRRAIEKRMTQLGGELARIETEIAETESRQLVVYAPALGEEGKDPQSVVDAQRNAFLAAERFRREKTDRLRGLRRDQRERLRELRARWKDFGALRDEVLAHYRSFPTWFRDRLDCPACPTAEQIDAALSRRRAAPPTPTPESESDETDE